MCDGEEYVMHFHQPRVAPAAPPRDTFPHPPEAGDRNRDAQYQAKKKKTRLDSIFGNWRADPVGKRTLPGSTPLPALDYAFQKKKEALAGHADA